MRIQPFASRHLWFRLFLLLSISLSVPVLSGCNLWTKACNRAAEDRRQLLEALAPLGDPYGGALSTRARDIEEDMATSQAALK